MNKKKNNKHLLMKVSCCALGIVMLGSSIISGFYEKSISALAAENTQTNVAYFEGLGAEKSATDIHNTTRMKTDSSKSPSITVFVHGQSGEASHWSNDGAGNFCYDEASLIEKLRDDHGDGDLQKSDGEGLVGEISSDGNRTCNVNGLFEVSDITCGQRHNRGGTVVDQNEHREGCCYYDD